jgi:hypothetical protein
VDFNTDILRPNHVYTVLVSYACHQTHPSYWSWFDYINNMWRGLQIMKGSHYAFPPTSCLILYSNHLLYKCSWKKLISSDILKIIRNVSEVQVTGKHVMSLFFSTLWTSNKCGLHFVFCYPRMSVPNVNGNLLIVYPVTIVKLPLYVYHLLLKPDPIYHNHDYVVLLSLTSCTSSLQV